MLVFVETGLVVLFLSVLFEKHWWRIKALKARRAYIRFRLRRTMIGGILYLVLALFLTSHGLSSFQAAGVAAMFAYLLAIAVIKPPNRSRYIPKAVRQAVLRRDLGDASRFDGKTHAIDHRVPFSRWGDNSIDNLRVIPRSENLRKSNKMPTHLDYQAPKQLVSGKVGRLAILLAVVLFCAFEMAQKH